MNFALPAADKLFKLETTRIGCRFFFNNMAFLQMLPGSLDHPAPKNYEC
jgi:hypothetical protein